MNHPCNSMGMYAFELNPEKHCTVMIFEINYYFLDVTRYRS